MPDIPADTPAPTPESSGSGSGGSPDASPDLLARVATWFGSLLTDIVGVLADPEGSAALLSDFGWTGTPPVLPPSLLSRLDTAAQGGTDADATKMETYAEVVIAFAALIEAMSAAKGDMSLSDVPELVADLLDATAILRLRRTHPTVWATLRALSLLSDDGAQLANLGDLVGDTHKYLLGLTTGPGYAQDYQDWSTAILGAAPGPVPHPLHRGARP